MQDPNSVARPNEVEAVKKNLIKVGLGTQNKTAQDQLKTFYSTVDARAANAYTSLGMTPPNVKGLGDGEIVKGADGKSYKKVTINGKSGYVPVK